MRTQTQVYTGPHMLENVKSTEDIGECKKILDAWSTITSWEPVAALKEHGELPDILDIGESMVELVKGDEMSLSRLADGELGIMTGEMAPSSGYQVIDDSLKQALADVMRCEKPRCRIALPKRFFYWQSPNMTPGGEKFVNNSFVPHAISGRYLDYVVPGYKYMDASMTVLKAHYPAVGDKIVSAYYSIARLLAYDKDIILVTGDNRYGKYEKNFLKDCMPRTVTVIGVPAKNSWVDYENIKRTIFRLNRSGSKTVLLSCGPAASVLAYELSDDMRCIDVGHVFADYNLAMGGDDIGYFWG